MARSGQSAPGWRKGIVCLIAAVLLAGCGVPDDFPTPTPTREASPTPTATARALPSPTATGTITPTTATTRTTPTIALSPSPLSLRPTTTTQPTPTEVATPTPSTSDTDSEPDQTINRTIPGTATAPDPGPGPAATIAIIQPDATATGIPIATIEPTVVPPPTATPTFAPAPTATLEPTATLVPEPTPSPDLCPGAIPWYDAINHLGTYGTVIGPVVDTEWAEEAQGKPTFLNVGLPYPDPGRFTVLMWIDARWNFDFAPEEVYLGATICVTGTIELYEGSPEMIIEGPEWIWVP